MNTIQHRSFFSAFSAAVLLLSMGSCLAGAPAPAPVAADVSYGPHPHQLLDVYVPKGAGPFPVLIWYGGLWEPAKHVPDLNRFFPAGIAVVGVESRTLKDGVDDKASPPVSYPMNDACRAVQFVRLNASKWNLDPGRIAVGGGSQGTLPALYVGCSADHANSASTDEVERVSSRVICVAAYRSQPSIDPRRMQEWVPGVKWGAPSLGCSFEESLAKRDELLSFIQKWSPDALVHKGAAPVYFENEWGLTQPDKITVDNYKVHSPAWALGFQKVAQQAGAVCYVKFPDHPTEGFSDIWDFIVKQLKAPQDLAATPPSAITAALKPFVDDHVIAGCVALVATKDRLLALEPVGYADMETKGPMKADTMFWIASMTKAHSCAAFMTLVDEGKVKVDDPVEKYFPEYKGQQVGSVDDPASLHAANHPITIKECMTHTAGLAELKARKIESLKEDVAAFGKIPLNAEPGAKYKYSIGIDIAGGIIELISGITYPEYMQKRLFDPLGMKDATFFPKQEQVDRMARSVKLTADKKGIENVNLNEGHQQDPLVPNGILCQHTMAMPAKYKNHYSEPSGGLFATAADVMKFCQMLLNEGEFNGKRILSAEAVRQMTGNQIKGIGTYGFGLNSVDVDGQFSAGSYNHRGARSTMMWVDKKRQLVMVLLVQNFDLPNDKQKSLYDAFTTAAFALQSGSDVK